MIRSNSHIGSARLLAAALVPMLAATVACTGQVSAPNDDMGMGPAGPGPMSPTGSGATGSGEPGSGATGNGAPVGSPTGSPGAGGSGPGSTPGDGGPSTPVAPPPLPGQALPVDMQGSPVYTRFNRLTNDQYENSVRAIMKMNEPTGVTQGFLHAVSGVTDFTNNERVVIVNDTVWRDFQDAAETVAAKVTQNDQAVQAVVATTNVDTFVKTLGRRAFRRDLTAEEVQTYTALHAEGATFSGSQSEFTKGAALVISAMLQSPHFLYRTEMADKGAPLSSYEMAAKLSLWLHDVTPSEEMLDAAKNGAFDSAEEAVARAEQMLEEPAAKAVMRKFHSQLYKFDQYDNISKASVADYTEALNPELKESAVQFFDRIFAGNFGVKEILTTNVGFMGPTMARLYGMPTTGSGFQQVTLAGRSGYYAQPPFLTLWAVNDQPDSIHRGVRINIDTLCAIPGMPAATPPVPALEEGQTNRDRYTALTGACGGACHADIINPVGFAFENFDGLGRQRDTDNGIPVNTTGKYPLAEGVTEFQNSDDLMQAMANGKQAHQCYAKRIAGYALQRDLVEADRKLVEALGAASLEGGANVKGMMLALIKENAFRTHAGGSQ